MAYIIPPNDFWGRKFGYISKTGEKLIDIPRGSQNARKGGSHSGPAGGKTRWYVGRLLKPKKK